MESSDFTEEQVQAHRPYASVSRFYMCPLNTDSIDEGNHNIPRTFQRSNNEVENEPAHHGSPPTWFIRASRNHFSRFTRPRTIITPIQIEMHRISDESLLTEDEGLWMEDIIPLNDRETSRHRNLLSDIFQLYGPLGFQLYERISKLESFPSIREAGAFLRCFISFVSENKQNLEQVCCCLPSLEELSKSFKWICYSSAEVAVFKVTLDIYANKLKTSDRPMYTKTLSLLLPTYAKLFATVSNVNVLNQDAVQVYNSSGRLHVIKLKESMEEYKDYWRKLEMRYTLLTAGQSLDMFYR
jgi:hypothetical protein